MSQSKQNKRIILTVALGQTTVVDQKTIDKMRSIYKENCKKTLDVQMESVQLLVDRIHEKEYDAEQLVIMVVSTSDKKGNAIARAMCRNDYEMSMSYITTLSFRDSMISVLADFDREASDKLYAFTNGIPVVVVDYQVAEVFQV